MTAGPLALSTVPAALSGRSGNVVLTLLGMMAAVAGVLVLAWLTARWVGRHGAPGGTAVSGGDENFRVLRMLNLGQNERLALVLLGERCLLLGVSAGQIALLRELSEDEAALWLDREEGASAPPSFWEAVRKNLPKGK